MLYRRHGQRPFLRRMSDVLPFNRGRRLDLNCCRRWQRLEHYGQRYWRLYSDALPILQCNASYRRMHNKRKHDCRRNAGSRMTAVCRLRTVSAIAHRISVDTAFA